MNTPDKTSEFDPKDVSDNKVWAILSYCFIVVIVAIIAKKDSPYVKYNANQGLVVFILMVISSILGSVLGLILGGIPVVGFLVSLIFWLVDIALTLLEVFGIVNSAMGKAKELPFLGKIKLLK